MWRGYDCGWHRHYGRFGWWGWRDSARRFCWRLRTRSGCKRNPADFYRLRLRRRLRLRCNRRRGYRRRRCWHGNRCWFFQRHRLANGRRHNCRRSCRMSLLGGDPYCWSSGRCRHGLRCVSCLSMASALQRLQLTGKVGNFVIEFGGFTAATVVGNQRDNNGWRTHHHPPKQEQKYGIHQKWLGKYG